MRLIPLLLLCAALVFAAMNRPPLRLSADQLVGDFLDNPVTANAKYIGKEFVVTGVVGNVSQFAMHPGEPFRDSIELKTERICAVRCLSGPNVRFSGIQRGRRVALRGRFAERRVGIFMTSCVIEPPRSR